MKLRIDIMLDEAEARGQKLIVNRDTVSDLMHDISRVDAKSLKYWYTFNSTDRCGEWVVNRGQLGMSTHRPAGEPRLNGY